MKYFFETLLICTIFATPCFANSTQLYGGVQGGMFVSSGSTNDKVINDPAVLVAGAGAPDNFLIPNSNRAGNNTSIQGGGFLGFLWIHNCFGIGPEFFINYVNSDTQSVGTQQIITVFGYAAQTYKTRTQYSMSYGGVLRLGYQMNSWFLYGTLGIQRMKIEYNFEASAPAVTLGQVVQTTGSKTGGRTDFIYGLGIEKEITPNWRMGLDVRFSQYQTVTTQMTTDLIDIENGGGGGGGIAGTGDDITQVINPSSSRAMAVIGLRLSYVCTIF